MAFSIFQIILLAFVGFALVALFVSIVDKNSTWALFVISWKYRKLLSIRDDYRFSIGKNPPDSYDFFKSQAVRSLMNSNILYGLYKDNSLEILEMLKYPSFIHYYFSQERFPAALYYKMNDDFRTGKCKREYDSIAILKEHLPIQISSSEGAFNDFMKFVDAGWFDKSTGMYILKDGIKKQHIGRAIYWICHRNGIPSPEKVFSPLWNTHEKKIREWFRTQKNETLTDQKDDMVDRILKQ